MSARSGVLATAGLLTLAALAGCETTMQKSERLKAREQGTATVERGLRVAKVSRDVRVLGSTAISDANGTAVVVTLRGTARGALADVPIAIDVRDRTGASLFRNDGPGAEPGLVSVALLASGSDFAWVHDQVQAAPGAAAGVRVRVGEPRRRAPADVPRLSVGRLRLTADPESGVEGRGRVTNRSSVDQQGLTIHAVARRGARVVAAGRAAVNRLPAGTSAPFSVYFIGDPAGARITLAAPPTVLG